MYTYVRIYIYICIYMYIYVSIFRNDIFPKYYTPLSTLTCVCCDHARTKRAKPPPEFVFRPMQKTSIPTPAHSTFHGPRFLTVRLLLPVPPVRRRHPARCRLCVGSFPLFPTAQFHLHNAHPTYPVALLHAVVLTTPLPPMPRRFDLHPRALCTAKSTTPGEGRS